MKLIDIRDINEIETPVTAYQTADQRQERIQADRTTAESAGFAMPRSFSAEGKVNTEEEAKRARRSRQAYEKLPELEEGITTLEKTIASEKRHELSVNVNKLRMSDKFELGLHGLNTLFPVGDSAFIQLASHVNIPARTARWLRDHELAPPAVALFQHALANTDKTVKVRGRAAASGQGREVFAVVGPNYPVFDAAPTITSIIRQVLGNLPGARAEVTYKRDTAGAFIDIVFHSDIKAGNYGGGELFKAGVRIRTEDGGKGSAGVSAFVVRASCTNFYILSESVIELDRVVHAGSVDSRIGRVTKALVQASQKIDTFAARWSKANLDEIRAPREIPGSVKKQAETKAWADATTSERIAGLVQGYVHQKLIPPLSADHIHGIVDAYWKDEVTGKDVITTAGMANALSLHAHTGMDRWSGDALERAAGALTWHTSVAPLYQHVHTYS